MTSEIVLLREPGGKPRYTGWFRKLQRTGKVIYTGFYTPRHDGACVKVVFPMPNGNATVILRPENDDGSGLRLDGEDTVRCEHDVRFLGFRVLTLHYRIMTVKAMTA